MRYTALPLTCWLALNTLLRVWAADAAAPALPLFRVVDLNRGEATQVTLSDGKKVNVKLIDVDEARDAVRSAVRLARATVEIDGRKLTLDSGNYRLPMKFAGVQIDCPITKGYYVNCDPFEDSWGLEKDARLRLWPAKSAWFEPGKVTYPARQRWFATQTQIGNEPAYVDGGDLSAAQNLLSLRQRHRRVRRDGRCGFGLRWAGGFGARQSDGRIHQRAIL